MHKTKRFTLGAVVLAAAFIAGGAAVGASRGQAEPPASAPASGTSASPGRLLSGSTQTDDRIKAITPCRLVDTRPGTPLVPTEGRYYAALGTSPSIGFQGGKAGGCGIPESATAIQITVTSVSATGTGFIRTYPAGLSEPTASFMNYGNSFNTSGSGLVKLNAGGDPSGKNDFRLRNYGSTTDIVVDVQGYVVPPTWVQVKGDGSFLAGSNVESTVRVSTGTYRVEFGTNVADCSVVASGPAANTGNSNTLVTASKSGTVPGAVFVQVYTATGTIKDDSFTLQAEC